MHLFVVGGRKGIFRFRAHKPYIDTQCRSYMPQEQVEVKTYMGGRHIAQFLDEV